MREQLDKGIIERVPDKLTGEIVHWIPHQAVIRDNAESTKLRIVYDCSARNTSQDPSLNDLLETGPPLQLLIFDILLKNRMHQYCITGDIQKAFLQIKIQPQDRDALRLLWYNDLESRTIEEYRFTRVIFGSASSPYILGATLSKHLDLYKDKYPKTVEHLQKNTYVDDVQCSADNKEELIRFKEESREIMAAGGFTLHKWHSNADLVEHNEEVGQEANVEETYAKTTVGTHADETNILGIKWNKSKDMIEISFEHCIEGLDGIAAPVIIVGKIIYSEVCLLRVSWDEELPKDIQDCWNRWIKKLEQCPTISIPRSVTKENPSKMTVHGFSDASKLAVAAAVYVVDSTTVLHWLQGQGRWSQYVRNRTRAIQEKDFIPWHYVPTDDNPADLGSRGVSPKKLDRFWKEGPLWLINNEEWPEQPEVRETSQSLKEKLGSKEKQLMATEPETNHLETLLLKHPYNKMLRITAYIMRFIRRCQKNEVVAKDNIITVEEIETAETFWIKRAQEQIGETKHCQLTEDECELMRYNGRIPNYNPIWLPRNHKLTDLIIAANHRKVLHNGVSATMASVRDRFWVPKLRTVVKKLDGNCNWCKRFSAKPLHSPTKSMLPDFRVVMDEPFAVTGVDFAGPIEYKQNKNKVGKAYVALFTCTSTRAVHLKLCKDMTAEEFKIAFKEFMAR
ncbi:uncharacterized protein LOC135681850 [Rhopilema esculentum]|uniref:uncharacterized protein LOC135681850 n=1 Tax=Rhopilema esculentum TaxID=499914 RepID=UPI0031DABF25